MRTCLRIGLALLMALAFIPPVSAQTTDDRISFNAVVGSSFANVGTTFSTFGGVDVKLNDRITLVGEVGALPHAPLSEAGRIAPPTPAPGAGSTRVNAYHWNGNVKVRPFLAGGFEPYVTGGIGSFTADTLVQSRTVTSPFEDRRRVSDFATNIGAGVIYRLNDWIGVGADYRTFFVHRDNTTPVVNRFTAGLMLSVK